MALTDDAHALIREHFDTRAKQIAIDATCGNGFDTEFLVSLGFNKVHAFDVQAMAIESTRNRLAAIATERVQLHLTSHERMSEFLDQWVDCVMFNFGYLPSGDKSITTNAETTITALNSAKHLLSSNGVISLMCYPGHPAGAFETESIRAWLKGLDEQWLVETHLAVSPKPTAPILYLVKRITL